MKKFLAVGKHAWLYSDLLKASVALHVMAPMVTSVSAFLSPSLPEAVLINALNIRVQTGD